MPGREITYTTNATIATTDVGYVIEANNSSTDTLYVYIPDNATIPFAQQDEIRILRSNSGPVVITVATGAAVSVNGVASGSATIVKEFGLANLIKIGTDSWVAAGDVATGFDTSLDIFTANVPALTDVANIQTAFYNYHYGQPNVVTEFNNLGEGSVAKYLYMLKQQLDASEVGELVFTQISTTTSLNTITTAAGFYYSPDIVNTTSVGAYAYPETKPGILAVYKNASDGFTQTYQSFTTVVSGTGSDNIWMRSTLYNNSAAWSNWAPLAKGDLGNYFTKTEIINRTLDDVSGVVLTSPSSGQTLTYNGSNWVNQTPSGIAGYSLYSRTVFTTTGVLTIATTAGIRAANIIAVGGGGGGGGVAGGGNAGSTYPAMSGGGGGGTYIQTLVTLSTTVTGLGVTVGAGGPGGAAGVVGTTGGTTIVRLSTTGSTIVSAPGGSGGSGKSGYGIANGGAGGTAGSFNGIGISIPGGKGGTGVVNLLTLSSAATLTTDAVEAPGGGSILSPFSFTDDDNTTSTNGVSYGAGGSGNWVTGNSLSRTGGTGAAGIVIIDLYV